MRINRKEAISFFSMFIFVTSSIIPMGNNLISSNNKSGILMNSSKNNLYLMQTSHDLNTTQKYLSKYNNVKIDDSKIYKTSSISVYGDFDHNNQYIRANELNADFDIKDNQEAENDNAAEIITADNSKKILSDNNLMDIVCKGDKKVVYLTFDDGPTPNVTPQILDILEQNKIKATFFVIGYLANENKNIIKREYQDGNSIGIHSYTHEYAKVYKDEKSFINELDLTASVLKNILGQNFYTHLFRFPGGSFEDIKKPFIKSLALKGYYYIDWNALSGDADGINISPNKLFDNVKKTITGKKHLVILMHDAATKETTVKALPQIIKYIKDLGYTFEILN